MAGELTAAPVLSTPEDHLFEYDKPDVSAESARSDDELRDIYEIPRTAKEILDGGKKRIALQFPDRMLGDAPKIVELLGKELENIREREETGADDDQSKESRTHKEHQESIWILADTSYSACCVDEVAAEHVDADIIIHYGRSCLSPTSRLPVSYVFTKHNLDLDSAVQSFESEFPDKEARVVLMADVAYQDHVQTLYRRVRERGYKELLSTRIQHNPLGSIPNRTILDAEDTEVEVDETKDIDLKTYSVFHISTPPTALLLVLSSRVASLHIFPTLDSPSSTSYYSPARTTRALLSRRYAKLLSLTTAGIIGILVNTLSVANYLSSIDAIRKQIAAAGKKSYTVVVGKLNPAKLANFAEMDGWVVVGCWESSLVEEDAGFYRPVLTPFELQVALMPDEERVWGLSWWGGIESLRAVEETEPTTDEQKKGDHGATGDSGVEVDEDESEAPVFDLRTGKLVSTSRPMRMATRALEGDDAAGDEQTSGKQSDALAVRPKAELATINGVLSPGAEYLRSQRTWQGLGSDFDEERSATIEEGHSGVARGYTAGKDADRR